MAKRLFATLCVLALILGGCSSKRTQQKSPLIPREILFGNPEKDVPALSPDGTRLAYLAPDEKGVLNVWLRDLSGKKEDQLITSDKSQGIHFFCWQYDGSHILYLQDGAGDQNWHLFQTDILTKVTRDLTPFEGVRTEIIAYEAQFPNEILVQLNIRNRAFFDVYRINLEDGSISLEVENDNRVLQWLADHELKVRACCSYDPMGGTLVQVRDDNHSSWRDLLSWDAEEDGLLISFSPDNFSLYLISNLENTTARLLEIDLTTNKQKTLAEDPQYDLGGSMGIGEVMQHPISHNIEAIGVTREYFEWIVLDPTLKQDFAFLQNGKEEMRLISRDLSNQHWIVQYSSDTHPPHFYLYDRDKKENRFLFSATSQLESYSLSDMKPITFKARDGMQLYGYLTLPAGHEPKNLPAILFVHGGPWSRDRWGYHPFIQWLANRGYAVLQVNFRGSAGYGKKYLNAGNREWGGKMHTDLLDGKQWLVSQGYAKAHQVAISGASYGGYATLCGLAFTPDEFCCGIDLVGPSNLISLFQTLPPYWSPHKSRFYTRIGNMETEKEFLESRSPLFKADKISRPLLIAHGANDPIVKQSESDQIVASMRQNGKEVEYLLISDEGHGLSRPENKLKFCILTEDFLHKYLGGRSEP